ncbi:helix-turn-helix domain-containing protein [Rhodococcus sp. NPDC057529]|uniref:AraC-like ligand-binding domain-containing protein n=1 Tax=Rhodococcus sp. NPDC057529 TaxID=3346158 RepID=UPI00366ED4F7
MADNAEAACTHTPFDPWQHAVSEAFVPLEVKRVATADATPFRGTLHTTSLGKLQFSEVAGRQVHVRRTPRTIKRSDPGMIKVGLQRAGTGILTQNDRETLLTPGDFAIYDTSFPYDLHFTGDFDMLVLMFPRNLFRFGTIDLQTMAARRIRSNGGVGTLVSPFLRNLHGTAMTNTVTPSQDLEDGVINLLESALHTEMPTSTTTATAPILLTQAKGFIETHLGDIALDTTMVATRHHVSTRHLQKTFEEDGATVAGWIRTRRLEKCRRDLADPALRSVNIAAICARYGLVNSSHFSKLFKETYGMSPRAFRDHSHQLIG